MLLEAILLLLIVLGSTAGELCITRAMKVIGEVKDFGLGPSCGFSTGR